MPTTQLLSKLSLPLLDFSTAKGDKIDITLAPVAQRIRALRFGRRCREFKSLRRRHVWKATHMDNSLITQADKVFSDFFKREIYLDQPYAIKDLDYSERLITEFKSLLPLIPKDAPAETETGIVTRELGRICSFFIDTLEESLTSKTTEPMEIVARFQIEPSDIEAIRHWLKANRQAVVKANTEQMEKSNGDRRTSIPAGSRELRRKAEDILTGCIEDLKALAVEALGMEELSALLSEFTVSIDSVSTRATSNRISKVALVSLQGCVYMSKGSIYVDVARLIKEFAHEVVGHCLNYYLTEHSKLPIFVKENFYLDTSSTRESVSDHMERYFFAACMERSKKLSSNPHFYQLEKEYTNFSNISLLEKYYRYLESLGIWVLATSKMDDHRLQTEKLEQYSIEPKWVSWFINRHRNNWDRSTGLLLPSVVSDLRYSLESVDKQISKRKPKDMLKFHRAVLTGCWTPKGFENWVDLTGY